VLIEMNSPDLMTSMAETLATSPPLLLAAMYELGEPSPFGRIEVLPPHKDRD
jgi:hypothetical protein